MEVVLVDHHVLESLTRGCHYRRFRANTETQYRCRLLMRKAVNPNNCQVPLECCQLDNSSRSLVSVYESTRVTATCVGILTRIKVWIQTYNCLLNEVHAFQWLKHSWLCHFLTWALKFYSRDSKRRPWCVITECSVTHCLFLSYFMDHGFVVDGVSELTRFFMKHYCTLSHALCEVSLDFSSFILVEAPLTVDPLSGNNGRKEEGLVHPSMSFLPLVFFPLVSRTSMMYREDPGFPFLDSKRDSWKASIFSIPETIILYFVMPSSSVLSSLFFCLDDDHGLREIHDLLVINVTMEDRDLTT